MECFQLLSKSLLASTYELKPKFGCKISRYIVSTPETRAICNDPFVYGVEYTNMLCKAVSKSMKSLVRHLPFKLEEREVSVLNILRGSLNFGIREALTEAFGWNQHSSIFIGAQRSRSEKNPEDWHITENDYRKIQVPSTVSIIFGDVVATGTTLQHILNQLRDTIHTQGKQISSIIFFTIGGPRSEEIIIEFDKECRKIFPKYEGSAVVYFEGRFSVAEPHTPVRVKYTGTDLLRRDCIMVPEFIKSQYNSPTYALERCTIYDAGSRAFWVPEYLEDVLDYWKQTTDLARKGASFAELLRERAPEIDAEKFKKVDLLKICEMHVQRLEEALHGSGPVPMERLAGNL